MWFTPLKPFEAVKDLKPVKKWSVVLGLLVLFCSGLLIGALGTTVYFKKTGEHLISEGPPGIRKMVMKKLVRELDLTEPQKVQIDGIVTEVQAELRKFRAQHQSEIEAIIDHGIAQMKPLLSSDQLVKLDALSERLKQHLHRKAGQALRGRWMRNRGDDPSAERPMCGNDSREEAGFSRGRTERDDHLHR